MITETAYTVSELYEEKKTADSRQEMIRNFDEIESNIRKFYDDFASTEPYQSLKAAQDKLETMEKDRIQANTQKDEALERLKAMTTQTSRLRDELKRTSGDS